MPKGNALKLCNILVHPPPPDFIFWGAPEIKIQGGPEKKITPYFNFLPIRPLFFEGNSP